MLAAALPGDKHLARLYAGSAGRRPECRGSIKQFGVTAGEVGSIIDTVIAVAEPVAFRFLWRPQLKDPSDEMVLETAVNGSADYLATFNLRHLREPAALFGVEAVVPGLLWRKIRSRHEKE